MVGAKIYDLEMATFGNLSTIPACLGLVSQIYLIISNLQNFIQYFIRIPSGGGTRRAVALLNQSVIRREHSDGGGYSRFTPCYPSGRAIPMVDNKKMLL